jgi:Rad3-related DNA helicase
VMLIEITNERNRTMENLESQITSLDQRLNLALVEKINKEIKDIKVRLNRIEKINQSNLDSESKKVWIEEIDNLSEDEKEWLDVFKK